MLFCCLVVWLFSCLVECKKFQPRQRDFSLFTKNHVVWSSCCLVVLLVARSPQTASARFFTLHFSLFTFHSSLFTFHSTSTAQAILHSSFFNLHFNRRCDVLQVGLALPVVEGGFLETVIVVPESEELVDILRFGRLHLLLGSVEVGY